MRIAVASDDAERVSQHFGRAPYYVVFTVEERRIAEREVRSKAYHHAEGHAEDRAAAHGEAHEHRHGQHEGQAGHAGHDHHGHDHGSMLEPIADCQVVLVGGMGQGAYESLRAAGVEAAFVQAGRTEDAVADYLAARTVNRQRCEH